MKMKMNEWQRKYKKGEKINRRKMKNRFIYEEKRENVEKKKKRKRNREGRWNIEKRKIGRKQTKEKEK